MTTAVKRTRSLKIHVWVCPALMRKFNELAYRLGMSRDGAIEKALKGFIESEAK